jgi:hypothetical protein
MLCSGGCFLAKTVGVRPAEWQQRNIFFNKNIFLRSFPERMFREVSGGRHPIHAARDGMRMNNVDG